MNHKNIISVIFTTNQPRVLNFHEFFTNDLLIRKNSKFLFYLFFVKACGEQLSTQMLH